LETAPRAAIARHSLVSRGALITAANIGECCQLANDIAAEHVQVMCADAPAVAANIHNAGGLFIGAYSCVPLGDYGAGPNHVLPTAQTARFASPLGVHHFIKRTGIFQATAAGARIPAADAVTLARAEGLFAHAEAAALRTKA
jgi:histidinol dehydrogenase